MSEETILVAFSHDGKKFELECDPSRPISHLMDRIEELTEVPPANMKVIFAGKTISNIPQMPIGQSGLKGKSKVMVMGKKVNSAEESLISGLKPMKSDHEIKRQKLDACEGQVKNYENGFIQETKQLEKEIITIAEYLMRILEKLDGYQISEEHKVARQKRKDLVKNIQCDLDRCDVLRDRLKLAPTGSARKTQF